MIPICLKSHLWPWAIRRNLHLPVFSREALPPPVPYSSPGPVQARPGIVTAIGVISIVVACISGITSLILGGQAMVLLMIVKMTAAMPRGSALSVSSPNVSVYTANSSSVKAARPSVGVNALSDAERDAVNSAFSSLQPLSAERSSQLQGMLVEHGRELFPHGGTVLTSDRVGKLVTAKSSESAAEGHGEGSSWYVIPSGRITLFDDRAVFASVDGTTSFESRAADVIDAHGATDRTLTPQQVSSIVAQIQTMASGRLSSSQIATLQHELAQQNQPYIDPAMVLSPAQNVLVSPDGSVSIQFGGVNLAAAGSLQIDRRGQVISSNVATVSNVQTGFPNFRTISTWKIHLAIAEDLLSIGLAIYLFVIGIVTLRQSLSGRRLHLVYAWIKIPLAVGGGVAILWITTMFLSMSPGFSFGSWGSVFAGVWISVIGCIYPIALIICLNSRAMREYYGVARLNK